MIVLPMAGESRRFRIAGYAGPKYRFECRGVSLFEWALSSFRHYFGSREFLFIALGEHESLPFIRAAAARLGLSNWRVVELPAKTAGQAETVRLGLAAIQHPDRAPLTVFPVDTLRTDFRFPAEAEGCDGFIEAFSGDGDHWSFVRVAKEAPQRVVEVVEKRRISGLCCTGLYHFRGTGDFRRALDLPSPPRSLAERRERFVAPLYNALIGAGRRIYCRRVDESAVDFFGTPAEYDAFCASRDV
jgi:hypothetical protein